MRSPAVGLPFLLILMSCSSANQFSPESRSSEVDQNSDRIDIQKNDDEKSQNSSSTSSGDGHAKDSGDESAKVTDDPSCEDNVNTLLLELKGSLDKGSIKDGRFFECLKSFLALKMPHIKFDENLITIGRSLEISEAGFQEGTAEGAQYLGEGPVQIVQNYGDNFSVIIASRKIDVSHNFGTYINRSRTETQDHRKQRIKGEKDFECLIVSLEAVSVSHLFDCIVIAPSITVSHATGAVILAGATAKIGSLTGSVLEATKVEISHTMGSVITAEKSVISHLNDSRLN